MATKLTSSLRKSINAEKQSVEDKQPEINKKRVVRKTATKPIEVPKVESTELPVEPMKSEIAKDIKLAAKTDNASVQVETKKSVGPILELGNISPFLQKSMDMIKNSNAEITNYSHEFISSFLENLLVINDDLADYIKKLLDIKNVSNIHNVNLEFLTTLRKRQKELIDKNMQLTSQLEIFKLPKLF